MERYAPDKCPNKFNHPKGSDVCFLCCPCIDCEAERRSQDYSGFSQELDNPAEEN